MLAPYILIEDDHVRLAKRLASHTGDHGDTIALAWLFGARRARNEALGRRACRICGCWEDDACQDGALGCAWVAEDLCSACDRPGFAMRRAPTAPPPAYESFEGSAGAKIFWAITAALMLGAILTSLIFFSGAPR